MARYILLMTLTPEGREKTLRDSETILSAGSSIRTPETQMIGLYGVLGDYDFVGILDAPDNAAAARFSLELGVSGGVHITTLPAIPIARLDAPEPQDTVETESHLPAPVPEESVEEYLRQADAPESRP
ncbi:MAG: GYD domain-containing protein [Chloroflexi bacterium]|nr:GYD domain-containing protein [Chloroflexota bacterium]